jgi:hypothetical protein
MAGLKIKFHKQIDDCVVLGKQSVYAKYLMFSSDHLRAE